MTATLGRVPRVLEHLGHPRDRFLVPLLRCEGARGGPLLLRDLRRSGAICVPRARGCNVPARHKRPARGLLPGVCLRHLQHQGATGRTKERVRQRQGRHGADVGGGRGVARLFGHPARTSSHGVSRHHRRPHSRSKGRRAQAGVFGAVLQLLGGRAPFQAERYARGRTCGGAESSSRRARCGTRKPVEKVRADAVAAANDRSSAEDNEDDQENSEESLVD